MNDLATSGECRKCERRSARPGSIREVIQEVRSSTRRKGHRNWRGGWRSVGAHMSCRHLVIRQTSDWWTGIHFAARDY